MLTNTEAAEWLKKAEGHKEALDMVIELLEKLEWHTMDEHPEDGEACVVKIYGRDMVLPQEGESLKDAIAKKLRETEDNAYTEIAYWSDEDGEFVTEFGSTFIIQPKYWRHIPRE